MKKHSTKRFVGLVMVSSILIIITMLSAGCQPDSEKNRSVEGRKIEIVSTVGMIDDAVKIVGGDRVDSLALMGPGVDPHLYRATAGDVKKLDSADIVFYGGLELEGRMTDIFVKMASRGTVTKAVSESIPESDLREPPEFDGKFDPHVWFNVRLWKHAVETIRDTLIEIDPTSKAIYEQNATQYLEELDDLHNFIKSEVEKIPPQQRVLITAHDAFGYFGDEYGFDVIGIQGTSTAAEASASSIRDISQLIVSRKIKSIFIESSVPKSTIEAVKSAVESKGWKVKIGGELFSDAMGTSGTEQGTYIGMVKHNVNTIVGALR